MESVECERNDEIAQLSLEKKARLDEVIRRAELSVKSVEIFKQCRAIGDENKCLDKAVAAELQLDDGVGVAGELMNYTNGTLTLYMQHQYVGYVTTPYTNHLYSGKTWSFSLAGNEDVVEAAVVYSGKNHRGDADCGWLLGFLAKDPSTIKVYAVCGPIDVINTNWEHVKANIEIGGTASSYYDEMTGTSIDAAADGSNGYYYVNASIRG